MSYWQHFKTSLIPLVRFLAAMGLLGLTGLAAFGIIAAYRAGWIQLPKQSVKVILPVRVSVAGPHQGTINTPYIFSAEVTGDAGTPTWSVSDGIIQERDGGRTAIFTTTTEGEYVITVVVGGEGRQATTSSILFQAFDVKTEDELQQAAIIAEAQKIVKQQATTPPKPPTISELVGIAVGGGNDMSYASQVEAQLRTLASRVQYGRADYLNDGAMSIIARYPGWSSFPEEIKSIVVHEQSMGRAKTPSGVASVLMEIADTLKGSR